MKKLFVVMLAVALLPAAVFAQQSGMRGEVSDNTGGVLPGVTVEACSPVLIEGCRVAISDGAGIYFITNLQPGTYGVTMSLPGFSTFVQEEIIVPAQFVSEVNGALAIGGVEETITVTGESPVVDTVQSSRTETFTREIFDALPTTRSTQSLGYLAQGTRLARPAVGGFGNPKIHSRGLTTHHTTTHLDGMQVDQVDCDFCGGGKNVDPGLGAEFAMTTSSATAEVQTGGFRINVIPREGGNTQSGHAYIGFSGIHLSNSNIDSNLMAQGISTGNQTVFHEEFNPSWGGPILRDRLWFFASSRWTRRYTAVANTEWPDSPLMREALPDLIGEQGIQEGWGRTIALRLTGQITERQKASVFFERSFSMTGRILQGWGWENVTLEPLEGSRHRANNNTRRYLAQVKYTYTPSSRTLVEFGYSERNGGGWLVNQPGHANHAAVGRRPQPRAGRSRRPASVHRDAVLPAAELRPDPGVLHRWDPAAGQRLTDAVGRRRSCVEHGVPGVREDPTGVVLVCDGVAQLQDRLPVHALRPWAAAHRAGRLLRSVLPPGHPHRCAHRQRVGVLDVGAGIQLLRAGHVDDGPVDDQPRRPERHFNTGNDMWRATGGIPASRFKHARLFESDVIEEIRPRDWSPRFSIVYDLFGDAKTAVKFSANRYTRRYTEGLGSRYHPVGWGWDGRRWADCSLLPSSAIPGGLQVFSGQIQNCRPQGMLMSEGFTQAEADFYLSTNGDGIAQDHEIGRRGNTNVFTDIPPTEAPTRAGNRIDGNLKRESNVEYTASIQQ